MNGKRSRYNRRRSSRRKSRRSKYSPSRRQLYVRRIPQVPSGMPNVRIIKLRYADTISITSTAGALGYHVYRANSLYDTDVTGVGHQPMGYDLWTQMYNHYCVLGAKIYVKAADDGLSTGPATYSGVLLSDDSIIPHSTSSGLMEEGFKTRIAVFQRKPIIMSCGYSAKKFFNVANVKDNVTRIGATISQNPFDQAYFHIWQEPLDGSSTQTMFYSVVIEFVVLFSEPKKGVFS